MTIKSKNGEYTIEKLEYKNIVDVEKLHTAVYSKITGQGFFAKKYDTGFTPVKYIGFIAYNVDKLPVAFYGVIPCFIKLEDKNILSAQSADTMTHPNHRHKGLFIELALLTYGLCRDRGIHLIFGFPNQNSLHAFIKNLGWEKTGELDYFVIQTGISTWRRIINKIPILKNINKSFKQTLLKKYALPKQGIDNSAITDGYAGIYRDLHYLKYKTYTDTHVLKIGPSIVWVKLDNEMLIGDITLDASDFEELIYHLKKLACKLGIKKINFHTSKGTTLHSLFAGHFAASPSFAVIFLNFEDIPIEKIKFTSADIDTF